MESNQPPAATTGRADLPRQRTTSAPPAPSALSVPPAPSVPPDPSALPDPSAPPSAAAACRLLDIVRALRVRERGYFAAVLHDGPIQELAAATLELSLSGDDLGVPQRQVEAAGRSLRRLVDELAPLPQAGAGLAEALMRRVGWLLATPLAVDLGEGATGLGAAEVETVADLVELMLFGAVGADAPDRALAAVRADDALIVVELNVVVTDDPAQARAWLDRLATAMQAESAVELRGHRLRARMEIPRRPRA
jgi:hypothetical protein